MAASARSLEAQIRELGPWHHEIEVQPGINTRLSLNESYPDEYGPVSFLNMRDQFRSKILGVYPEGLEGRSVLDCGCNCGECLFWAKELGAGACFGFDAREHWIRQGRFLAEHSQLPSEDVTLEVMNLYDLPGRGLLEFDVVLFHGLLYHLPDPVTGLRIAAEHARELMFVSTATASGYPDGMLRLGYESEQVLLHGTHGLHWRPTGPEVVEEMLRWTGFVETKLLFWDEATGAPGWGRLEIVAAKREGLVAHAEHNP